MARSTQSSSHAAQAAARAQSTVGASGASVYAFPPPRGARAPEQSRVRKINTRDFHVATRSTSREINRQIVLNLIREHQPISRAELARRMNVRRSVLTTLVRELVAAGIVHEKGTAAAVRGRRPTLLHLRMTGRLAAAVDVRAGRTTVALVDFAGKVVSRDVFMTPDTPEVLADRIAEHLGRLVGAEVPDGAPALACRGVGLVIPGMVDRRTGRILYAPRLGWRDVELRDAVSARVGLPVYIESAPIACALARLWSSHEEPRAVDSFAYVSISDGVGVGLVMHGEALRGEAHTAGEFGHVSLDPNGPVCICGRRGCWEAFASNAATVARYTEAVSGASTVPVLRRAVDHKRVPAITIEEVIRRARRGEPAAVGALVETGRHIGRGIAAVVSAFNPGRVYVGGEITAAWDVVEGAIRASLVEWTITDAAHATPIVPDQRGAAEYRLQGAVALVAAPTFAAPSIG